MDVLQRSDLRRYRAALPVLAALTGLLAALLVVLPSTGAQAATAQPSYDTRLLVLVNQARVANGLAPLALYDPLSSQARQWSERMAANDSLVHDAVFGDKAKTICSLSTGRENIAFTTGNADSMFRMYMNSPGHRAAILSADTQFFGVATVSVPWPDHPSIPLYWNTMRFVGGTCPRASTLTSSTPTTLTMTPLTTPATPGTPVSVRLALVAPAGPARSATLYFVPARTGVAQRYASVALTASSTRPTLYRATISVNQSESGTWRLSYAGTKVSSTVGDSASYRAVYVSARTKVGGFVTGATKANAGSYLTDTITVSPEEGRTVYHQVRSCSTCAWTTYRTYSVPDNGSVTLSFPVRSSTRYWRVYVPQATSGLSTATSVRTVSAS